MEFNVFQVKKRGAFSSVFDVMQDGEYVAIGEKDSMFSSTIHLRDTAGKSIYDICRESMFSIHYYFERDGYTVGRITKATFSRKYTISSDFGIFEVEGNFWSSAFTFVDKDKDEEIAKISKKSKAFGSSEFGIAIRADYDGFFFVAVLIAMIKMLQAQKSS